MQIKHISPWLLLKPHRNGSPSSTSINLTYLLQIHTYTTDYHTNHYQKRRISAKLVFRLMENLIKQMRVRFSGVEQEKRETDSIRNRRIPPQQTQSFKGGIADKKKSWFSRQFSGQMNQEYDEYPTALAAAAFAIKSLEDSRIEAQRKANTGPDTSTNTTSKSEDKTTKVSKPRTESRKFSDQVPDKRVSVTNENMPEKVIAPAPSIKKTPTFADKNLNKSGNSENTFPKPDPQYTKPLTFPPTEIRRENSTNLGTGNTKADVWEKAEMAKINERYEKLSATILVWENKKKAKAKRKMDKLETELEKRRAKAMQRYRTKMEMIEQIAGGARAQAEQNRRKEELQVKDKANRIRTTGKSPPTCFCF